MNLLEPLRQDLRYGVRTLRRHPGFTAISVLALALGIAVNTVVFTAYKVFVARPLDARDPATLVNFAVRLESGATTARFSYPDYEIYRDSLRSVSGLITFSVDQLTLSDPNGVGVGRPAAPATWFSRLGLFSPAVNKETVSAFVVSENYFSVLGVAPVRGRAFDVMTAADLIASPAVLISENYWQRRFASDPDIVGKHVRLNGSDFTIAGITPADFTGTSIAVPNVWLPDSLTSLVHPGDRRLRDREDLCCRVFGRLAPGISMAEVQAEATVLSQRVRELHDAKSESSKAASIVVSPGSPLPGITPALKIAVVLIMTAAAMVLVIAGANAAGLQLARATARRQEMGMRCALGASRWRLIRQLLTESALLGVLGGTTALPVTWAAMRLAVTKLTEQLPPEYTFILDVTPDLTVFAYVLGLSVLAGVLFGLPPALTSTGSALAATRSAGGAVGRSRLRHGLIAAQVAVSLTLLIAGGLLIRSAVQALTMDTGYETDHLVGVTLEFSGERTITAAERATLTNDVRDRLAAVAGVTAITIARAPSVDGGRRAAVSLNGEEPSEHNTRATIYYTWVQSNYFETLGIPLIRGEGFGQVERANAAIVSEAAARRLWPSQDPIGQLVRLGTAGQAQKKGELVPDGPTWQIVGVARDTRGATIDRSDSQQLYLPLPPDRVQDYPVLLRTSGDPDLVVRRLENVVSSVDPALGVTVTTLRSMLRRTQAFLAASLSATIATVIGICGLLLASMGIYSTVSYDVVLRTRELGIRMAIGAPRSNVLGVVMRGSLQAVLVGVVTGLVLATGAARLLRGVLYGLGAVDAMTFAATSLLFVTIALVASWLPSRRAMRIDPLIALRDQ